MVDAPRRQNKRERTAAACAEAFNSSAAAKKKSRDKAGVPRWCGLMKRDGRDCESKTFGNVVAKSESVKV